jgi:hypothetical protein
VLITSPADAFDSFERAKSDDLLVQGVHHQEAAGRQLSDILGVLGDELQSPSDCPARIMPLWLAHAAFRLFRAQSLDSAKAWGSQFYAELKRLDGKVPVSVVYDWHANVVEPFVIEFSKRDEPNPWGNVAPPTALQTLHAKALSGDKIAANEWRPSLYDAFLHIFADRTSVNLNNIDLNNMGKPQDKENFFHGARLAEVNARAYTDAFASADADGYARANAEPTSWGNGFDSYAAAAVTASSILSTHARLLAYKGNSPPYDHYRGIQSKNQRFTFTRLADGLLQCLTRVAQ